MKNNKICISSTGRDLDANVDPRFGRSDYFLIINPDTMNYELIINESQKEMGGAGIKAAERIAKNNVKFVITGKSGEVSKDALSLNIPLANIVTGIAPLNDGSKRLAI